MTNCVCCFGEIMLRLSPPGYQRFAQVHSFDATYGGGEANVIASLAKFGVPARYITRLPANELGDACIMFLRQYGIDTSQIIRGGERIGIYFIENGAMQRASNVIYDRSYSSMATIKPGMIDWKAALAEAAWFHWTGITPAIGGGPAEVCSEGIQKAKELGIKISCDLNYRAKLWKWGKTALEIMEQLVKECDLLICNEEDAENIFGIKADGADWKSGAVKGAKYRPVAEKLINRFPNLKLVAITLRGSLNANHNTWAGLLFDGYEIYISEVFQLTHIVDRVGGGDAFAAGLIYGLIEFQQNPQRALDFAVAASCLKHSIWGDINLVTRNEVDNLISGEASGRVSR